MTVQDENYFSTIQLLYSTHSHARWESTEHRSDHTKFHTISLYLKTQNFDKLEIVFGARGWVHIFGTRGGDVPVHGTAQTAMPHAWKHSRSKSPRGWIQLNMTWRITNKYSVCVQVLACAYSMCVCVYDRISRTLSLMNGWRIAWIFSRAGESVDHPYQYTCVIYLMCVSRPRKDVVVYNLARLQFVGGLRFAH